MIWTVVRFPNGSWSYGGRPESPDYAGCEVWRIYAATGKIAVKRAQSRRRSDAASKARLAGKDTAPGQAENRGQPVMEDLTWEAQIGRVRKEYEDETTALRARIEELEAEVARLRDEHVGLCQKLMSDDKARFGDRTIYPYICSVLKARTTLNTGKDTP